jgi:hypothetical protein
MMAIGDDGWCARHEVLDLRYAPRIIDDFHAVNYTVFISNSTNFGSWFSEKRCEAASKRKAPNGGQVHLGGAS